ncbi:hypothetical protein [Mesobacillus subterraneus]|uniref:Uncharacterized protein n=1 Tax=Mesobacillus subterraneus TaxID=285983 RepID=A0A427TJJ9_9BACI|nr:hypothetical protein [Mesobacillus subterraneus]RSD24017.1 hypothetical protein EJA10_19870 [Mesobacillus subterraneus]
MHFRKLIITGFIAGAVMLVPDLAFAEKGNNAGKSEQVALPDKAVNGLPGEKSPNRQQQVKKPEVQMQVQKKPVNQRPVQAKPPTNPADAAKSNGKAPSIKKNEKAAQPSKATRVSKAKPNQPKKTTKTSNKSALKSIHNEVEYATNTTRITPGLKDKVELQKDSTVTPVIEKKTVTVSPVIKPSHEKKDHQESSSKNEGYPKGDNLPNPPSRSKASGGPSGDRTSFGNTSTSFTDKWFIWNESYYLTLIQPYTSRIVIYRSQWVNAPPSPPPLQAPDFLTYSAA